MKQTILASSAVLALFIGDVSVAAPPDLAGTTWNLNGKFKANATVTCKVGGSHSSPAGKQPNIKATLTFNSDGSFSWSNDTLSPVSGVAGTWRQKGKKVELNFNNPSSVSYIRMFGTQYFSSKNSSAEVTPNKYKFFATTNGKGTKLEVTENGGFKLKASASYAGSSNTCNYNLKLQRVYKGTPG
jgi:hypothetical protein